MNSWMNVWMTGWMNEWINGGTNEQWSCRNSVEPGADASRRRVRRQAYILHVYQGSKASLLWLLLLLLLFNLIE